MYKTGQDHWARQSGQDYVFCHNDLSPSNIIVNPETLKINAIVDWEYAGFYPAYFEASFWTRAGPSVALDGEEDDVARLVHFLDTHDRV
ncbi:hypothetical protein N7492_004809 [Penicillium capsulatum]|uniref:non-specific serine/threonine protein kinase n=1 Tax=Penicillium capsulatum TaxID=69766 RepID=A0A9W9IB25_9EURO|nr:hypothetical protein N7492_004809 [Penicillium capsulatum]